MVRGVPEGSPLSPTLFNMYIDILAEAVLAGAENELDNPANFFADDVVLMSRAPDGMQRMLDVCSQWAYAAGLKWGVSKCSALTTQNAELPPLILAGEVLKYAQSADYLGVRISARGVTLEKGNNADQEPTSCRPPAPKVREPTTKTVLPIAGTPGLDLRGTSNPLDAGSK